MDWSRPVVTMPIADFGSPHDIVTKDDIHIRHFEQRRTWAVGGIHRIRNQDDFQFFVLHNSWLPSVHIKRYVMPQYRFGAIACKTSYKGHGGEKEKICNVVTKPIHLHLDGSHKDIILNVRVTSIFGYVQVGIKDALCHGHKDDQCRIIRNTNHGINADQNKKLSNAFGYFTLGTNERIINDVVNKKVEYQWYGAPKWWDKRAFIQKNGKEVENIERNTQKRYGLLRLAKLLRNIFPKETGKDTYPIQLTFNLKDAEIYGFRFE